MSSKFSHKPSVLKEPSVCRKPPNVPLPPVPPIIGRIIQGYVYYNNPATPAEGYLTGYINLTPISPSGTWFGRLVGDTMNIELTADYKDPGDGITYDMEIFQGVISIKTYNKQLCFPQSVDPFDGGEITFEPPPYHGRAACHIMA